MKQGKIWGQTELLEANGVLEFHRIEAKAGGVCSKHKHKFKWNGFFVESGKMIIRVWKNNYDLVSVKGNHVLFKLVKPDELTHFDGDESDRISY